MRLGIVFLAIPLLLAGCAASPPELAPVPGETVSYVQRFRLHDRVSGGEPLTSITIEQDVDVTCTSVEGDRLTLSIGYGDVRAWIDGDDGDPDFVATDADAAERVFAAPETDLATMFGAMWATNAHVGVLAQVERSGNVASVEGGREAARTANGDDPSGDLGGAFLESLLDDPALLWAASDANGRRPIRFHLEAWNATFKVVAEQTLGDAGAFEIGYESHSGAKRDGPFSRFDLVVSGTGVRDTATGLLESATLRVEAGADVPAGEPRRDTAVVEYVLRRADAGE